MSPRHVRTFTTGAVASIAIAVTGTAVLSSTAAPEKTSRLERSAVTEAGPTTVAPDKGAAAGQRGQSVGAGLRDKALRTAVLTDIPPSALAAYQRAASSLAAADPGCHLTWSTLAAIGQVESNHGRSTSRNARGIVGVPLNGKGVKAVADTDAGALDGDAKHDRAVGPMQPLPGTWSAGAVDGDGDGKRDPQDIDDAALAAAVYLCGSGADMSTPAGSSAALRSYNDSASYVTLVQSVARSYAKDEKASYSIGSLQTGGIDYSAVSIGNPGVPSLGTDATPAKKAKTTKAATTPATKTPAATPTKTPTGTPTPGGKGGTKPATPTPAPTTPVADPPVAPAPAQVTVPQVSGTDAAATSALQAAKLVVASGRTFIYSANSGAVRTDPAAGASVTEGSTVTLTVSLGKIENVVGKTLAEAKTLLDLQGVTVLADPVGAGDDWTVTAQDKSTDATAEISSPTTVTLTLQAPAAPGTGQ